MKAERRKTGRAVRPGYARVSAFERVWNHIEKLDLDRIDQRTVAVVGVTGSAATECLAALGFLGIRSEDGSVTDSYAAVKTGDLNALVEVVDNAYSDLLRICPMPAESREQLEAAMGAAYGLKRGRMSMAAAALFGWLYEQTGRAPVVDGGEKSRTAESKRARREKVRKRPARPSRESVGSEPADLPPIMFAINVQPSTTAAEIRRAIAEVRSGWRASSEEATNDAP